MERTNIDNNSKYQAALVRADAKGYMVSAIIKSKKHNEVIGCVVTGPDSKHNVIVDDMFLLCDCHAGDHAVTCVHVAVVQRKLMERAAQAAQTIPACHTCGLWIVDCLCDTPDMYDALYDPSAYNEFYKRYQDRQQELDRLAYEVATGQDVYDTTTHAEAISAETENTMRGSAELIIMREAPAMASVLQAMKPLQPTTLRPRDQEEW